MKIWITFLMFCTQISVIFSNQTISTIIIYVFVLVSSLINTQNQNMILNFHVRVKTGKTEEHTFIEERHSDAILKITYCALIVAII